MNKLTGCSNPAAFLFMTYHRIVFADLNLEKKEMIIALLANQGFSCFEEKGSDLITYLPEESDRTALNNTIKDLSVSYTESIVEDQNWNEIWERNFKPVSVIPENSNKVFAHIRADFHLPIHEVLHDIIITPKMSFGTAHHPTTYGMIEMMSSLDFTGKDVIDFGTGTGILAILAEKMGAKNIMAIDCDEWGIKNARENFCANKCNNIELVQNDFVSNIFKVDVLLANINLNIILLNLDAIYASLKEKALVLISGMLIDDEMILINKMKKGGLMILRIHKNNNWLIVLGSS
ncbi:MAG: 50S ribosomal protein L11 methyltransferase [Ferruginibacter sp.]